MPLPKGYTLDQPQVKLPAGYKLDQPAEETPPPGVPAAPIPPGLTGPSSPNYAGLALQAGQGIKDLAIGAGRGLSHTLTAPAAFAAQELQKANIPGIKVDPAKLAERERISAPANTTQAVGKGIEQAGEFLVPGAAEEKVASLLPAGLRTAGRIGASALSSGLVNKAQGGNFATGAAAGGAGGALGAGARFMAPKMAEAALGIPKVARAFGRTPGSAVINETRGIIPETIAHSAQEKLDVLNPELEARAAASPNTVSLKPARDYLTGQMNKAESQNAEGLHGQLNRMGNTLSQRFGTKQTIPQNVSASDALNLKRGFGEEHTSWNPEVRNRALSAGRHTYGLLDKAIDQAVPEGKELNQRISSLIPVQKRAESISRNAPLLQRVAGRFGAHTGALTLGGIGAAGGYKERGIPGAIAGGITGAVLPEVIASPEIGMLGARALGHAGTLRPITGLALQLDRPKPKGRGDQEQ